jgi:hypothetical protein
VHDYALSCMRSLGLARQTTAAPVLCLLIATSVTFPRPTGGLLQPSVRVQAGQAQLVLPHLFRAAPRIPSCAAHKPSSPHPVRMASLGNAEEALAFCRKSTTAVIATLWPTAHSLVDETRFWLVESGCAVVHESSVYLTPGASIPAILALYHGEDWLESNCW